MIECGLKLIMEPIRMELLKKTLPFVALTGLLSGCQITEEEKEKLEQAGENLEKIASAPFIAYPAENDRVTKSSEIRLVIDDSVNYQYMALLVDGIEVAVDDEAPYQFQWDPYFWSQNEKATLIIRAVTEGENLLRSDVRTVLIDENVHNLVSVTSPYNGQVYQNINSTPVSWNAREGAASYDLKVNNIVINTDQTSAQIDLPAIGDYSVSVRARDNLGNQGQWSDEVSLTLAIPSAPDLYLSEPMANENDWQVSLNWNGSLASSEVQIATDSNFTSILENEELLTNSFSTSLVTGIYYARVRTKNEFGYIGHWSEIKTIELGLFSAKVDMNTYGGWSNEDAPVDFVIEDDNLAIVATQSNEGDGSGDDFYVSKVNLQGQQVWGRSYKPHMNSPKTITRSTSGYLLPAHGSNWRDAKLMELDLQGNISWHTSYDSVEDLNAGDHGNYSQERTDSLVEVSPNKFVALQRTSNCIYTGPANDWGHRPSSCLSENTENKIKFIDRSGAEPVVTDHQISQPVSGKYDLFTQLLLTDSGLYAAGRYTAANDSSQDSSDDSFEPTTSESGVVLVELSKADGSILSTRTAGGIKDYSISSLAQAQNGDIVASYNYYNAAVTSTFKVNGTTDSKIESSLKYAQVAADPSGNGYIMLAQGRSTDSYFLTRYDENNNKVGSSIPLAQCFWQLRPKKIKSHPKHGLVILGTDKWGSGYDDTHTVYFNVTDDFKYLCSE